MKIKATLRKSIDTKVFLFQKNDGLSIVVLADTVGEAIVALDLQCGNCEIVNIDSITELQSSDLHKYEVIDDREDEGEYYMTLKDYIKRELIEWLDDTVLKEEGAQVIYHDECLRKVL